MKINSIKIGALIASLSIMMGAFGAHLLKDKLSEKALTLYETGVRYQLYHAFALIIVGILYQLNPNKQFKIAATLFLLGILFFSGSLYVLSFKVNNNIEGLKWVGPITPLGGLCFILGWLFMAFNVNFKKK